MPTRDFFDPASIVQRDANERAAEAHAAYLLDADMSAFGERPAALDKLARHGATPDEVLALALTMCELADRAGLLDAVRIVAASLARQRGDLRTLAALGASAPLKAKGTGGPGSYSPSSEARWAEQARAELDAGSTVDAPAQEHAAPQQWTTFADDDAARANLSRLHLGGKPLPELHDLEATGRETVRRVVDRSTAALAQTLDEEEERQRGR